MSFSPKMGGNSGPHFGGNGVGQSTDERLKLAIEADLEKRNKAVLSSFQYDSSAGKAVKAAAAREDAQGQGQGGKQPDHIQAKTTHSDDQRLQRVISEGVTANAQKPQAYERPAVEYDDNGKKRSRDDTAENRNRMHDVSSALRGRMDAFEAAGKVTFEDAFNLPTERGNAISDKAFMKAQEQLSKPASEFSEMADRARSAGQGGKEKEGPRLDIAPARIVSNGLAKSEGQESQFSDMADRARSAGQQATEQGSSKSKSSGMEQ